MATAALSGQGSHVVPAAAEHAWVALLKPDVLRAAIPGGERVELLTPERFRATIAFGVGRIRGRYVAELEVTNLQRPNALDLSGTADGAFGRGIASAHVALSDLPGRRTRVTWIYNGVVSGPAALVGRRLLQVASDVFINRFFTRLSRGLPGSSRSGPFEGRLNSKK